MNEDRRTKLIAYVGHLSGNRSCVTLRLDMTWGRRRQAVMGEPARKCIIKRGRLHKTIEASDGEMEYPHAVETPKQSHMRAQGMILYNHMPWKSDWT